MTGGEPSADGGQKLVLAAPLPANTLLDEQLPDISRSTPFDRRAINDDEMGWPVRDQSVLSDDAFDV